MSFVFCPLYKFLLKAEIKHRISVKINEIQICSDWSDFYLSVDAGDIDLFDINYDDIAKQAIIWEHIAKLSVDLWRDYEYYSRFLFESLFESKEYRRRLEDLGYVLEGGRWKSARKPYEESVQTNVFMHCLYRMMVDEMGRRKGPVEDVQGDLNEFDLDECFFCDAQISKTCERCDICYASVADMAEARSTLRMSLKKVESRSSVSLGRCPPCAGEISYDTQTGTLCNESRWEMQRSIATVNASPTRGLGANEGDADNCSDISNTGVIVNQSHGEMVIDIGVQTEITVINASVQTGHIVDDASTQTGHIVANASTQTGHIVDNASTQTGHIVDDASTQAGLIVSDVEVQVGAISPCRNIGGEYCENWKCGRCGCFNDYSVINCEACADVFKEGTWGCGGCGALGISCAADCCNKCGGRNGNVTNGVKEDKTELKRDQWSCAHCTARNDDKARICACCSKWKDFIGGDIENIRKDQWVFGKCGLFEPYDISTCRAGDFRRVDGGSWRCGKCTFINKCSSAVCGACGACNDSLGVDDSRAPHGVAVDNNKKYKAQKKTKKGGEPKADQWLCRYSNCKKPNDMKIEYCKTCSIHRDYSGARGEEAHRMTKNGVSKGWICMYCHKFNELTADVCGKAACNESRYGEIGTT